MVLAVFHPSGDQSFSNKGTRKCGPAPQDTTSEEINYSLNLDKFFFTVIFFFPSYHVVFPVLWKFLLAPVENETWILQSGSLGDEMLD